VREVRSLCQKTAWQNSLSFRKVECQVDSRAFLGSIVGRDDGIWCMSWGILVVLMFMASTVYGEATIPDRGPIGLIWEASIETEPEYGSAVDRLLRSYEASIGRSLGPGERGKVGLKVNTRGGRGLSTPLPLLRSVVAELLERGYSRDRILIVDYSSHAMRQAGIMPSLSAEAILFEGCPVVALDSEQHYDAEWFYDSPLPPSLQQGPRLLSASARSQGLSEGMEERKSFLPAPLLFEVDFWFNLAVAVDDPAIGIDGALANATLWNVSNSQRFLVNSATASAAIAEIAAIPELEERLILNFLSLDSYQFIGGPKFNSLYTRSESKLWMSSDAVAIDRLLYDKINAHRLVEGFPEIQPLPRQLSFASSLGLGTFDRTRIRVERVE